MKKLKRRVRKFRMDITEDRVAYEEILNNSLCAITERTTEKESDKSYEDGKLTNIREYIFYMVHWEEKVL